MELDSHSRLTRGRSPPGSTPSSGGTAVQSTISPLLAEGHEAVKATIIIPAPSHRSRSYVMPWFRTNIPDNWREFSTTPVMVGPLEHFVCAMDVRN